MRKIVLISDTHSHLGTDLLPYLKNADEIWHAGDIGNPKITEALEAITDCRIVYGNIDTQELRHKYPLNQEFECDGVRVFMTHIGGYPGKYRTRVKKKLIESKPDLYICGHSHICKVVKDHALGVLHMNPGACGIVGIHQFRTILLFECHEGTISNLKLVELGLKTDPLDNAIKL